MTKISLAVRNSTLDARCRGVLDVALAELGTTPERVSLEIGLAADYLRTFMERGLPRVLPSSVRRRLAAYLGVPEYALR
jgi:hypothetical protein